MTRNDVNQYWLLIQESRYFEDKLKAARIRMESPRIPELTGQPGAKYASGSGSHQEKLADVFMDEYGDYVKRLDETRKRIKEIEEAVDKLPTKERMVTRWHCFERLSYKYIADVMELSITSVSMIQTNAYKLLEEQKDETDN
jgi:RNA polymerase sigma factor (sigma-70 family)